MRFLTISAVLGLMSLTSASSLHKDCEYSGITGPQVAKGTCRSGGKYNVGECIVTGKPPLLCDYQFKNDANRTPCGNPLQSQFACKRNGNTCKVFKFASNQDVLVSQCS